LKTLAFERSPGPRSVEITIDAGTALGSRVTRKRMAVIRIRLRQMPDDVAHFLVRRGARSRMRSCPRGRILLVATICMALVIF